MIHRLLLICFLGFGMASLSFSQTNKDSLPKSRKYLDLNFEAEKIDVDGEGNIFLLSTKKRQVYKLLKQFEFDSMISIGGASARNEALFHPIEIRCNTRQRIYVLDDVGQKVVLLNTDLKVLQSFDFALVNAQREEGSDIFPVAFDLSPTGEMLVLNQWNNTVLRYSNQLNPDGEFGGTNFGEGSLFEPDFIEVSPDQQVFVWDARQNKVLVYSLYGIFQYAISMEKAQKCRRMRIEGRYLLLLDGDRLLIQQLTTKKNTQIQLNSLPKIQDFAADRQYFYFLTQKGIYISPRSD